MSESKDSCHESLAMRRDCGVIAERFVCLLMAHEGESQRQRLDQLLPALPPHHHPIPTGPSSDAGPVVRWGNLASPFPTRLGIFPLRPACVCWPHRGDVHQQLRLAHFACHQPDSGGPLSTGDTRCLHPLVVTGFSSQTTLVPRFRLPVMTFSPSMDRLRSNTNTCTCLQASSLRPLQGRHSAVWLAQGQLSRMDLLKSRPIVTVTVAISCTAPSRGACSSSRPAHRSKELAQATAAICSQHDCLIEAAPILSNEGRASSSPPHPSRLESSSPVFSIPTPAPI